MHSDRGRREANGVTPPPPPEPEGCLQVDQVIREAVTRSALLSGVAPYVQERQERHWNADASHTRKANHFKSLHKVP